MPRLSYDFILFEVIFYVEYVIYRSCKLRKFLALSFENGGMMMIHDDDS